MNRISFILALLSITAAIHAGEIQRAAEPVAKNPPAPPANYIAHEWGTFTSVQGSDGILLDWRPLAVSDLPSFVYDRDKRGVESQAQSAFRSKAGISARQRMETPVVYFYTDQETTIDASVGFPEGLITEWYPRVRDFSPALGTPGKIPALKGGFLRWGGIRLLPAKDNPELLKKLLVERAPSHYYPARETDAAIVRHCSTLLNTTAQEYEKFLFYRGVGNFAAPLKVSMHTTHDLRIANTGGEELRALFLVEVKDGKGRFEQLGALNANSERTSKLSSNIAPEPLAAFTEKLGQAMQSALEKEGLYPREASAMVKTWKDAWFEESGVRVLYMLPKTWTDRTLPLTLNPKPTELVRVMVGRAEVLTPDMENKVETLVGHLSADDFETREKATRELQKFGRFTEPALQRAVNKTKDAELKSRAQKLLAEIRAVSTR